MLRCALHVSAIAVVSATLCYDTEAGEYGVAKGVGCGKGKPYTLTTGAFAGKSEVETISASLCQKLCYVEAGCRGFERVTFNEAEEIPLLVPKCLFRSADTSVTYEYYQSSCYEKAANTPFTYCSAEHTWCACTTEVKFGSAHAGWTYSKVPTEGSGLNCTAASFGLDNALPGEEAAARSCECMARSGLELLLDASNYVTGDLWVDHSGAGHHGILAQGVGEIGEKPASTAPSYVPGFEDPSHFSFDGAKQYLALKSFYFDDETLDAFSVTVVFRTSFSGGAFDNWSLLDFDRSQYFNVFVYGNTGVVGFSSHGATSGVDDMQGVTVVNDGQWHCVTVTYSKPNAKKVIYVDGAVDKTKTAVHEGGVGAATKRYAFVGEGSGSSEQFGAGDGRYYEGDIARLEYIAEELALEDVQTCQTGGRAIGDSESCEAVANSRCKWVGGYEEGTYYLSGADKESSDLTYIHGTDPAVLFAGVGFAALPSDPIRKVTAKIQTGCLPEDSLRTSYTGEPADPISAQYSKETCELTITLPSSGTAEVLKKVVRSIQFATEAEDFSPRTISWYLGDVTYSGATGHFYRFLDKPSLSWSDAKAQCEESTVLGLSGYLATITSATENAVVNRLSVHPGWIGLSDAGMEAVWRWVTGPEGMTSEGTGLLIGKGSRQFTAFEGQFVNWGMDQPDNLGSADYGVFMPDATWSDFAMESPESVGGVFCEYGGLPNDDAVLASVSGSVSVSMQGCVRALCNHKEKSYCERESGCLWSASARICFPSCPAYYYTELCNMYCKAEDTCSGRGECTNEGTCSCQSGWGGPNCAWERTRCSAWGSSHVSNFNGKQYDFAGADGSSLLYNDSRYSIYTKHYTCADIEQAQVACTKQVQFKAGNIVLEINANHETETPENGFIYVKNGSELTIVDSLLSSDEGMLPRLIGDIALVSATSVSEDVSELVFEVPENSLRIKVVQDTSFKAPYVNVFIEHYGSLEGVTGVCTGYCEEPIEPTGWPLDCSHDFGEKYTENPDFTTDVPDSSIKFCKGLPLGQGGCTVCLQENCNMGWIDSEEESQCAESVERVLLEEGLCEAEICVGNHGGAGCASCRDNYYGPSCELYCDALCTCKVGFTGSACEKGLYTCTAWGDPHYTTFEGEKYDFFGPGYVFDDVTSSIHNIQYEMYSVGTLHITARHYKCNTKATCMKQLTIWDERGGSAEVRIDGTLRVNCTLYTIDEVANILEGGDWVILPRNCPAGMEECPPAQPVSITKAGNIKVVKSAAPSYVFEVSDEVMIHGVMSKNVSLEVAMSARSKAIDTYIKHFGLSPEEDGVAGLCLGKPGSGKPGTGELQCFTDDLKACDGGVAPYFHCRTGPPPCAVTSIPKCWDGVPDEECGICEEDPIKVPDPTVWICDDDAGKLHAESCCQRQKYCSDNEGAYDQCIWDECALGSLTACLDNHEAALDFDDQSSEYSCACPSPHMSMDEETGQCSHCKADWFTSGGVLCSKYCNADISCNGRGTCDGEGMCWCNDVWEGENCLQVVMPPPASTACEDQKSAEACTERSVCFWDSEIGCCPPWFTPEAGIIKQPSCPTDECSPPKTKEVVIANVTGWPSNRTFSSSCGEAARAMVEGEEYEEASLCADGYVVVVDSDKSCDELYEAGLDKEDHEHVYESYYIDANTRVTEPFLYWDVDDESYFGYKICFVPKREPTLPSSTYVPSVKKVVSTKPATLAAAAAADEDDSSSSNFDPLYVVLPFVGLAAVGAIAMGV
eukprot:gene4532-7019_t